MPSRKRAKGRARKLKQQAREPAVERSVDGENINLLEQNIRRIEHKCDHGCSITPQGHPVSVIVDSFIKTMRDCRVSVHESLLMTVKKHQEVWKDDTMKKMVIDEMLSIGTNLIIDKDIEVGRMISEAIILLEKYTSSENIHPSVLSKATEDLLYIQSAEEREIVRFYKKRIPCSCLDDLYSELKKSQVRGGRCFHCKQTIKRKDLKTCSRCKFAQYCSKECQISAWPSHKESCIKVANIHERAKKEETARSNEGI